MSTLAEFRLPAADTTLSELFARAPEATVELESAVSRTRPCLWISGVNRTATAAAFEADPSIEAHDLLVERDDRFLYDVTFADGTVTLCDQLLVDGGSLLEAWAADGWWQVEVRYPDRDTLCTVHDGLVDRGVTVDLRRVSDVSKRAGTESRLTPEQQEALEAALENGYFEIPRDISMEELAAELGISHQALSERLRRAYETLVDEELQPAGRQS
ncbi:helix-turn-helix domain-containing protein [Halosolutus gelatinilyticus]|uniref:helix-turn-helix domain-containing protein n=1 Tax=Halosolutus gelatinilyticus TaxID=2931975 RepID=UPI001FF1310C|nr:helix-turn-helix domain-containing protein [Halosolutus gelatinilyticus]